MTTFASDSPDWFTGQTGGTLFAETITVPAGGMPQQGLSGGTGCIILADSAGPNIPVLLVVDFTAAFNGIQDVFDVALTADDNPAGLARIAADLPAYGAGIQFLNLDVVNDVTVSVFTTNRSIPAVRIEPSSTPGRAFQQFGAFVGGTPQWLAPADEIGVGYPNNAQAGIYAESSDAGTLHFSFRDTIGTQRRLPVMTLAANTPQMVTMPLPQCVGWFYFTPVADNPAGTITVVAMPAQL